MSKRILIDGKLYTASDAVAEYVKGMRDELDCLKSETVRTMMLCHCKKYYRLPSERYCKLCQIEELTNQLNELTASNAEYLKRAEEAEAQESEGMEATISQMLSKEQAEKWGLDEHGHKRNVQHIFMRACLAISELEAELARHEYGKTETVFGPSALHPIDLTATFLPECKWQDDGNYNDATVTFCSNPENKNYKEACSKRCDSPEKDHPSIKPDSRCDNCGTSTTLECTEGDCPVFLKIKDEKEVKSAAPAVRNRPSLDLKRRG